MSKNLLRYNTVPLQQELPELENSKVEIYFDAMEEDRFREIADVFRAAGHRKVKRLIAIILRNEYHDQLYKKGKDDVAIIKFTISDGNEQRQYQITCREIFENDRKVVVVQSCDLKK